MHLNVCVLVGNDGNTNASGEADSSAIPTGVQLRGLVRSWNDDRAFGFIRQLRGEGEAEGEGDTVGPEIFVHRREITSTLDGAVPENARATRVQVCARRGGDIRGEVR